MLSITGNRGSKNLYEKIIFALSARQLDALRPKRSALADCVHPMRRMFLLSIQICCLRTAEAVWSCSLLLLVCLQKLKLWAAESPEPAFQYSGSCKRAQTHTAPLPPLNTIQYMQTCSASATPSLQFLFRCSSCPYCRNPLSPTLNIIHTTVSFSVPNTNTQTARPGWEAGFCFTWSSEQQVRHESLHMYLNLDGWDVSCW